MEWQRSIKWRNRGGGAGFRKQMMGVRKKK
jgi:hypothetical protein